MKTSVLNSWNTNNTVTADREAQLKYSFHQHQLQLQRLKDSKKHIIDNEQPFMIKKRDGLNSKPIKERQIVIKQENDILANKMLELEQKKGTQTKKSLFKQIDSAFTPKSLFLPLKIATEKKVLSENKQLSQRIRNANSSINFQVYDKDFSKSQKYKDNITKKSRRIYNCFLFESPSSPSLSMTASHQQSTIIPSKGMKSQRNASVASLQNEQIPSQSLQNTQRTQEAGQKQQEVQVQQQVSPSSQGIPSEIKTSEANLQNDTQKDSKPNVDQQVEGKIKEDKNQN